MRLHMLTTCLSEAIYESYFQNKTKCRLIEFFMTSKKRGYTAICSILSSYFLDTQLLFYFSDDLSWIFDNARIKLMRKDELH